MSVRELTTPDIEWALDTLASRRAPLVAQAPIFWNPANDARARHRQYLEHVLDGGGVGFRTDTSVLIAAPKGAGWDIDDAAIGMGSWDSDGRELWNAFRDSRPAQQVRFVCPTYEADRTAFVESLGCTLNDTWWLLELADSGGGEPGSEVTVPGASAMLVGAPPVYAPPGPILFLPSVEDPRLAVPSTTDIARNLGCAAIVVRKTPSEVELEQVLRDHSFRAHCNYFTGLTSG